MSLPLHECLFVPRQWLEPLAEYGYENAEQFLSTCNVEGGRTGIAGVVKATEKEVRLVEESLRSSLGGDLSNLAPVDKPLGAILRNGEREGEQ